jgi:hypothetical protein
MDASGTGERGVWVHQRYLGGRVAYCISWIIPSPVNTSLALFLMPVTSVQLSHTYCLCLVVDRGIDSIYCHADQKIASNVQTCIQLLR